MCYFEQNHFQVSAKCMTWQDAINKAVKPLVDECYVKITYAQSIIKNVQRAGSSFIISPYIILPHARPEQGVIKNGVSVLLLKHPIYFDTSKEPIKLVIVLASENTASHLNMLKQIAKVLNEKRKIKNILESETGIELYKKFTDQ